MTDKTVSAVLEIKNKKGLHARAAAAFVKAIEDLDAEVTVERIGQKVNGCSIMGLMMLAAAKGTTISVTCAGNQAKEALDALTLLIDGDGRIVDNAYPRNNAAGGIFDALNPRSLAANPRQIAADPAAEL